MIKFILTSVSNFCTTLFFIVFLSNAASAQKIIITLGPDEIGENQNWTISFTLYNEDLKNKDYSFPDLEGFQKKGVSTTSSTSIVDGKMQNAYRATQAYTPTSQGMFIVPAFKMVINGQTINSAGKKVKVGPSVQVQEKDPLEAFFASPNYDSISNNNFTKWKLVQLPDDPTRIAIEATIFMEDQSSIAYGKLSDRNNLQQTFAKVPMNEGVNYSEGELKGNVIHIKDIKYRSYPLYRMYFLKKQKEVVLPEFVFYLQATRTPVNSGSFGPISFTTKKTEVPFKFEAQKLKSILKENRKKQ